MWIVTCAVIAGAALLGPVPAAMADAPISTANADSQAAPQTEVSMLAVSLTVGGAIATAGSGMALVLNRRRAVSRRPSRVSG
jgi:Flp pilus assembly protein CpaB